MKQMSFDGGFNETNKSYGGASGLNYFRRNKYFIKSLNVSKMSEVDMK